MLINSNSSPSSGGASFGHHQHPSLGSGSPQSRGFFLPGSQEASAMASFLDFRNSQPTTGRNLNNQPTPNARNANTSNQPTSGLTKIYFSVI
jgi:hypothetical protein